MFKDSSLQENLLFQNSKKFWELFFLSFSEKKTENTKWNIFSHSLVQMILYRLLRSDENPLAWLRAEDSSSSVFVEYHVTHGSSLNAIPSRYISCCKSLEAVRRFAGCQQPIVKTELNGNNPTVHSLRIIDLTDLATLNQHIPSSNERGRNFANAFQEVLIEGFIPPECISQ